MLPHAERDIIFKTGEERCWQRLYAQATGACQQTDWAFVFPALASHRCSMTLRLNTRRFTSRIGDNISASLQVLARRLDARAAESSRRHDIRDAANNFKISPHTSSLAHNAADG